jgi:hypothetical protein
MMRSPAPRSRFLRPQGAHTARPLALALLAGVLLALAAGLAGGLVRAGVPVGDWAGQAAAAHGALMVGGFMATVIGIERAVAVKHVWAWSAPALSAFAGLAMLFGGSVPAGWLLVMSSVAFLAVNVLVVVRQPAPHTALLLGSALAWLCGNLAHAGGLPGTAVLGWWFAFLVTTVAAERLEMTRLMRRRPAAQPALLELLGLLVAGCVASTFDPVGGGVVYGAALVLLSIWLATFDIARRTVRAEGLPRYMAVCLLGGYVWLALGGLAWVATAAGLPLRDAALHAIGLGFLGSMVMGHAPVILPAIARVKLMFGPVFYVPLIALHLSLAMRLGPGSMDFAWRSRGAVFNVLALLLFAATAAGAAWAWRCRHDSPAHCEPSP